jgi:hypothetical protein
MDEGVGHVFHDSSGNGNDAYLVWHDEQPNWSTDSPFEPNPKLNSYNFQGSDCDVPNAAALNPSGAFTIECWVKITQNYWWPSSYYLVSKRGRYDVNGSHATGYFLEFYSPFTFAFTIGNGTNYMGTYGQLGTGPFAGIPATDPDYGSDVWYHIAGVYDPTGNDGLGEITLYINGISNGGSSSGIPVMDTDALNFGYYKYPVGGGNMLFGLLDEVRLSDVALQPSQLGYWGSLAKYRCQDAIKDGYGYAADLNQDCKVNFTDFAMFAGYWMRCVDPTIGGCEHPWP